MIDSPVKQEPPPTSNEHKHSIVSRSLIARSIVSNWSYLTLNVLIALWMTPFVVHHLGDSEYGIWALVLQLTGYMGVVDVGLRSALVRFVARFQALGDDEGLNRLLNSIITLYVCIVPVCFVGAAIMAVFALPHMQIPAGMLQIARLTVFIAAACIACDFVFATSHASLAGLSRWDLTNGVWISVLVVRTALIILFLELGFGLVTVALIQFGVTLAGYSSETILLRKLLPRFRFRWQKPEVSHLRPVMEHGWYSFLLSVATKVNYQVDSIVIAFFLPIGEVTFYVIGLRLVEYLRDLLNSTTMIFAPLISSFDAVGEKQHVAAVLIRGTKYSLFVAFLGASTLLSLGSPFIRLWMGERFGGPSGSVLVMLTLGVVVSSTQFAGAHALYGLGKHRLNVIWTTIESILNLSLSIALVQRYGIIGVAAGTTIANIIVRGWLFPSSFLRVLDVPWRTYLRNGVAPAVLPALSFWAGTRLYQYPFPIHTYGGLLAASALGLVLFLACVWFWSLDWQDRKLIREKGRQLFKRS